jgi:hypothetical protein
MKKVFSMSFTNTSLSGGSAGVSTSPAATPAVVAAPSGGKAPIAQIKQEMAQVLRDMQGIEAERLRYKINATLSVNELWLVRSNLYQTVAKHHSQSEAALRINALLPSFQGWLPAKQLTRI